ncbi:hypothetical protein ACNKF0_17415 [Nocardioides sp. T5]|uniref:hypothetical protein n=1 Tax=Nocardioides sp. T5 TaxID=3400182 RepID=UPI003A8976AC
MSSRRTVRHLLVAVLAGVLVGGGLMAVTPAGAEISSAVATNWKKIWNKELKPQADKRYYTKKKSDNRFQPKGSYETAGSGYTKAETYSRAEADAKYQPKGNYALNGSSYTKAESDGKYVASNALVRGTYLVIGDSSFQSMSGSFGVSFASAPTVHLIPSGGLVPNGCSGTPSAPNAAPGNLCIFETGRVNVSSVIVANAAGSGNTADPFGFFIQVAKGGGAGFGYSRGSWAARPPAAGIVSPAARADGADAPASGGSTLAPGEPRGAIQ